MSYQELRPRQDRALDMLRQSLREGVDRLVLQAPTGFGKTRLGAAIVENALLKGNRVIFTVPAISLIDQTVKMFWRNDIRDVGVIQANHPLTNMARPVQVASVQTLSRRDIAPADVVLIDECHRWYKFYETMMKAERWQGVPFIGLSATPWTKGLGKWFDRLLIAGTIRDGINEGWLSKYRAFAPSMPDLSKVKTTAGDYQIDDLADAMDIPPLTADILETWCKFGQGRPTFLFAVNRAHAQHLSEQFERIGVRTAYVDAFTPLDEREEIRRKFEADEVEVVCNVGVLTTGVDWDVRCIILARPTKSEMLYVQMIGRGLRPTPEGKEDKDHCLILDHTGTTIKLGLVDDIHHDELDGGNKPKASAAEPPPPKPKICPKCHFLKPPRVHTCPACGFSPKAQSRLEPVPGELVEVAQRGPSAPKHVKEQWYRMFLHRQREKGYSEGWVSNQYRERFGEWPNQFRELSSGIPPSPEVLSWLKSQHIRFMKSAKRRAA